MLGHSYTALLAAGLAAQSFAAPAPAPAGKQQRRAGDVPSRPREEVKARQVSATVNPVNNIWPQAQGTGPPVVLDQPNGVAASGPPGASGQAYPTTDLAGYDGNPVTGDASVPSPTLIPAQYPPADDGLILDFQTVSVPQPIRGQSEDSPSGGTDDEAIGRLRPSARNTTSLETL